MDLITLNFYLMNPNKIFSVQLYYLINKHIFVIFICFRNQAHFLMMDILSCV